MKGDPALAAAWASARAEQAAALELAEAERPAQIEAARRLYAIAQRDTGQARIVARFLLGIYNSYRFPFALHELRALDRSIFEDCLAVLRLDYHPVKEIHAHLEADFEALAKAWGLTE